MTILKKILNEFNTFENFYHSSLDELKTQFSKGTGRSAESDWFFSAMSEAYIRASATDNDEDPLVCAFGKLMIGGYNAEYAREQRHKRKQSYEANMDWATAGKYEIAEHFARLEALQEAVSPVEYKVAVHYFSYDWTRFQIAKELKIDHRKVSEIINKLKKIA